MNDEIGRPSSESAGSQFNRGNGAGSGRDTLQQTRDSISDAATQAGTKVVTGINSQKTKAAESLSTVAQALRESGDQLRSQDPSTSVHQLVSTAADQVERLSGYMRSKSVSDMVGEIEQFARRQPAAFIGGALLLGLLGARFLKSSSRAEQTRPSGPSALASTQDIATDPRTSAGYWRAQDSGLDDLSERPLRGSATAGEAF